MFLKKISGIAAGPLAAFGAISSAASVREVHGTLENAWTFAPSLYERFILQPIASLALFLGIPISGTAIAISLLVVSTAALMCSATYAAYASFREMSPRQIIAIPGIYSELRAMVEVRKPRRDIRDKWKWSREVTAFALMEPFHFVKYRMSRVKRQSLEAIQNFRTNPTGFPVEILKAFFTSIYILICALFIMFVNITRLTVVLMVISAIISLMIILIIATNTISILIFTWIQAFSKNVVTRKIARAILRHTAYSITAAMVAVIIITQYSSPA